MIFLLRVFIHPTGEVCLPVLYTKRSPTTLSCLIFCAEQVFFFHLLNMFINEFRFHRLLCMSSDSQEVSKIIFFCFNHHLLFQDINTIR